MSEKSFAVFEKKNIIKKIHLFLYQQKKNKAFVLEIMSRRDRADGSRLFIGNLASEKTSREELTDVFKQYGNIVEDIVIKRSFGFVQFDSPESAKAAMEGEQGRIIGGMRLGKQKKEGKTILKYKYFISPFLQKQRFEYCRQ